MGIQLRQLGALPTMDAKTQQSLFGFTTPALPPYGADPILDRALDLVRAGSSPMGVRELDAWTGAVHYQFALPSGIPANPNIWTLTPSGWVWVGPAGSPAPPPWWAPPVPQGVTMSSSFQASQTSATTSQTQSGGTETGTTQTQSTSQTQTVGTTVTDTYHPAVTLVNLTRSSDREFQVGDEFLLTIVGGPANSPVVDTATHNGITTATQHGFTDSAGTFSIRGRMTSAELGTWREVWKVGQYQATPVLDFRVIPAQPQPSTTHEEIGAPSPPGPPQKIEMSEIRPGWTETLLEKAKSVPWWVWALAGLAVSRWNRR